MSDIQQAEQIFFLIENGKILGYFHKNEKSIIDKEIESKKEIKKEKILKDLEIVKQLIIDLIPKNPLFVKREEEFNSLYKIIDDLNDKESKKKLADLINQNKRLIGHKSNTKDKLLVNERIQYFSNLNSKILEQNLKYTTSMFYILDFLWTSMFHDNEVRIISNRNIYQDNNILFFEKLKNSFTIDEEKINKYINNYLKFEIRPINHVEL